MVFIKSQEYIDTFGKPSHNVICLEGQIDYKISFNPDTKTYDVGIVVGDFDKYLFSAESNQQCTRILQNIFTHHTKNDPWIIYDVSAFMSVDIKEDPTLEDVEDLMVGILEFYGHKNIVELWETKMEEVYNEQNVQSEITNESPSELLHPITSYEEPKIDNTITTQMTTQRYIHYN